MKQKRANVSPALVDPMAESDDIYQKDLGTMGIPREVAQLNQNNNVLFTSANKLGPGEYTPEAENVMKKAPVISFGKLPVNNKSVNMQWEEKMEKYIGVKPSEKKHAPKKENEALSAMQSFEQQMRNKQSFMF